MKNKTRNLVGGILVVVGCGGLCHLGYSAMKNSNTYYRQRDIRNKEIFEQYGYLERNYNNLKAKLKIENMDVSLKLYVGMVDVSEQYVKKIPEIRKLKLKHQFEVEEQQQERAKEGNRGILEAMLGFGLVVGGILVPPRE